jgi:integrase
MAKQKRRYGDGSIYSYETKNGTRYRWQATVLEDNGQGHSQQKRVTKAGFNSAKEANLSMQDALANTRNGKPALPGNDLFGAYAYTWLEKQHLANATIKGYEKIIRVHLLPTLGPLKLSAILPSTIAKLYKDLGAHGNRGRKDNGGPLTFNSVNKIHIVLGSILESALLDGKVSLNHARHNPKAIQAPTGRDIRSQQGEQKLWTPQEVRAFLDWDLNVIEDDLHALWLILIATGMRRGEGVALQWGDINFDSGIIAIKRASDSGLRKAIKTTKTQRHRTVLINEDELGVLKEHKLNRSRLGLHLVKSDGYVFGTLDGSVRNPGDVGERWKRLMKRAQEAGVKIGPMTLKGLRHTHATLLMEIGVNPKVVQERLGHSNISTTLNIYAHATATMQQDAVEQFAKVLKGA